LAFNHLIEEQIISKTPPGNIPQTSQLQQGDILIDVRHPAEVEKTPLKSEKNSLLCIPFYNLESQLDQLDPLKSYLLYCDKGIMSRLQANLMCDQGFEQVAIFIRETPTASRS
jgi:thiamine biosynthesis protein ThiI